MIIEPGGDDDGDQDIQEDELPSAREDLGQ